MNREMADIQKNIDSPWESTKVQYIPNANQVTKTWKMLVVDDDVEIHQVTRLVFDGFKFLGLPLDILNAYSSMEAEDLLIQNPDIAVILLDVVMESDDSGLIIAKKIRDEMHNHNVQIILRTGHPGQAPEYDVMSRFEINDYREKRELTAKRLYTCVTTAIRAYIRSKLLSEALEKQKYLSQKLVDIQELERKYIARELHDEVGQMLTALSVGLEICMRKADPEVKSQLNNQKIIVNELSKKVRTLILDLSPNKLKENGLVESIQWYFKNTLGGLGIRISFSHRNVEQLRFDPTIETIVFRVVQEAVTNAIRHAHTPVIHIRLIYSKGQLILRIRDDGRGFDVQSSLSNRPDHMGIMGMKERASAAGGKLNIISIPGKGTVVSLNVTVNDREGTIDTNSIDR